MIERGGEMGREREKMMNRERRRKKTLKNFIYIYVTITKNNNHPFELFHFQEERGAASELLQSSIPIINNIRNTTIVVNCYTAIRHSFSINLIE